MYSLGIVAKDKPTGTYTISVMPIEQLTDSNSSIDKTNEFKTDTVDHKNRSIKSHSSSSTVLEATWIPLGSSNRMSAPDVIQGETVQIYTYADTNEYYWTTIFNEPGIRRNEKVLYGFSNLSEGARDTEFDRSSSYWFEVDTLNKYVKLHTSENNGELTTYDISIDTKNGILEIKDGLGNYIVHNSREGNLHAKYNDSVTIEAPNFTVKTTNATIETTNYLLTSSSTIMETSGITHIDSNINTLTSQDMNVSSNDFNVGGGNIGITGQINTDGPITSQGNMYAKDFIEN